MVASQLKHVTTPLEYIPLVRDIQAKFDTENAHVWAIGYWTLSIPISVAYVLLVYAGRKWMESRPSYNLRRALFLWNLGLALFSMFGALQFVPNLVHSVYDRGFKQAVCKTDTLTNPHISIWGFLFVLSKFIELGDTIFIVLRKTPLQFLHWYHHMTVVIYSSMGSSSRKTIALGHWFGSMNYSVHTIMYTYYALRVVGVKVPSQVAKIVTILQLSQMFVGVLVNITAYRSYMNNEDCDFDINTFSFGVVIYSSYAVLFMIFFYKRYIKMKNKEE